MYCDALFTILSGIGLQMRCFLILSTVIMPLLYTVPSRFHTAQVLSRAELPKPTALPAGGCALCRKEEMAEKRHKNMSAGGIAADIYIHVCQAVCFFRHIKSAECLNDWVM
jgi:hypothetical protein